MKDLFVFYEQALELKQLGFDEGCLAVYRGGSLYGSGTSVSRYYEDGHWELEKNSSYGGDIKQWVAAPLKQQVFKWFREKHNLLGIVGYCNDNSGKFMSVIDKINSDIDYDMNAKDTYEEAESNCIDKLIELVKNKP